jgi:hypothetical protein
MNGHVFLGHFGLDRRVVPKYRVSQTKDIYWVCIFLCTNCAILVVFFFLNCAKCYCPASVLN